MLVRQSKFRLSVDLFKSLVHVVCVMKHARHILIVGLIALFALGSTVYASTVTSMAVDMAVADIQLENIGSCQACTEDNHDSILICDFVCLMTFVALPTPLAVGPMTTHFTFDDVPDLDFPEHFGTPEPTPPRSSTKTDA